MGSAQKLDQPDTWTAANLVALQHMHNELCQEYNCVEGMQDPPADAADANDDGARADSNGPRPTVPLSLPPLNLLASQHVLEDDEACKLPPHHRVTSQVMRHVAQHTPSQTTIPVPCIVTLMPCIRRRLAMPSRAQRQVNLATPSLKQMCQTGRTSTASHRSAGSIGTHPHPSCPASC